MLPQKTCALYLHINCQSLHTHTTYVYKIHTCARERFFMSSYNRHNIISHVTDELLYMMMYLPVVSMALYWIYLSGIINSQNLLSYSYTSHRYHLYKWKKFNTIYLWLREKLSLTFVLYFFYYWNNNFFPLFLRFYLKSHFKIFLQIVIVVQNYREMEVDLVKLTYLTYLLLTLKIPCKTDVATCSITCRAMEIWNMIFVHLRVYRRNLK